MTRFHQERPRTKCSKSEIASDFKSRRPNRKNFPQIAAKDAQIALSNWAICDLSPITAESQRRPLQIASDSRFAIRIANCNHTKSRDLEHLGPGTMKVHLICSVLEYQAKSVPNARPPRMSLYAFQGSRVSRAMLPKKAPHRIPSSSLRGGRDAQRFARIRKDSVSWTLHGGTQKAEKGQFLWGQILYTPTPPL